MSKASERVEAEFENAWSKLIQPSVDFHVKHKLPTDPELFRLACQLAFALGWSEGVTHPPSQEPPHA